MPPQWIVEQEPTHRQTVQRNSVPDYLGRRLGDGAERQVGLNAPDCLPERVNARRRVRQRTAPAIATPRAMIVATATPPRAG